MNRKTNVLVLSRVPFTLGVLCWGALSISGFAALALYSVADGNIDVPPLTSFVDLPFECPDDGQMLVMAIHPHCPCTRASLGELNRLLNYTDGRITCHFLIYEPAESQANWLESNLVQSARAITAASLTQATLIFDTDAKIAQKLGMKTSGSVVVYSPEGYPQFYGGITASRGHYGDNVGSDAIRAIVAGEEPAVRKTPVFGCSLETPDATCTTLGSTCCKGSK